MKNAELIKLARKTAEEIFAARAARTKEKFVINIRPIDHNGAFICAKVVIPSHDNRATEYWQVGFNCDVYAIAGRENIIKTIKSMYTR